MVQLVLTCIIYLILVIPVGRYLYHIAAGKHTFADPVMDRVDGVIYKLGGVDPQKGMNWKQYALALLGTNAVMMAVGYVILRIQSIPLLNPNGIQGMKSDLAFNTIISFMTNTNLQHYSGESGLSYLSQMLVIIFMMFVSAASGYAACVAFIRGLAGKTKDHVGNFFADLVRITTRVLLPFSLVGGLLLVWQGVSQVLGQEILLVSPVSVLRRLLELAVTADFWSSIAFSIIRIMGGFLLAAFLGILLGALAAGVSPVRQLLEPAVLTIKSIPVASFVILVLIWVPSENLSVVISFLMVFPVIYTNVLNGIESTDRKLLEMAEVFRISLPRRIRYIYASQILPFFRAGCSVALGLCWKAGVAAEVIGIPDGSIGERLYMAKVYLNTPDLFAWTIVIVLISLVFERLFLALVDRGVRYLERS